jgi:hypothetical protein
LRSVGHDLAHAGRHRVGVDNVLDRVAPVLRISGFKGARRSKCASAGCGEREVSHARQTLEPYMRQHAQAVRRGIEERAKDVRPCAFELPPKRVTLAGAAVRQSVRASAHSAVGKIGVGDNILDPIENDGAGGGKQNFVLIG